VKKYLAVFGKPRYLGIISCEEDICNGANVLVESVRGEDIAICVGLLNDEQEASYRALRNTVDRGDNAPKTTEPAVTDLKYLKPAEQKDLYEQQQFRAEEKEVLKRAKEFVIPHELDMKLIDVEYLAGRQKLFVYFSADQRVDFRAYVRDLAREYRTRIELRQIGVRDEARIVGGLGLCGNRCCCSYWLHQFVPVGIRMVKEQNLALNPTKISGICGRLMCCMCYEENVYHDLWEGLPQAGTKLKSAMGTVMVTGISVSNKALKCLIPEHGEKDVPIDKFEEFQKALSEGKDWEHIEQLIAFEDPCRYCQAFDDATIFLEKPLAKINRHQQEKADADSSRHQKQQRRDEKHKEDKPARRSKRPVIKSRQRVAAEYEAISELDAISETETRPAKQARRRRPYDKRRFTNKRKNGAVE